MNASPYSIAAVIPVHNGAALIRRSIDSVCAQSHPVDELIVVDDGSSDGTAEVLRTYGERIRCIHQSNKGVAAARNAGINSATSTWIAFLDHDDEWLPQKLDEQLCALRANPDAGLCYSAYWLHNLNGARTLAHLPLRRLWPRIRLCNPFPPSVVLARRTDLLDLGGFDERLNGCEDWDLFIRLLMVHKAVDVPRPLTNYYVTPFSLSQKYKRMLPDTLSIVDRSLLAGLSGPTRALWRRRILSELYYHAAISARQLGDPAMEYLARSLGQWPIPDRRIKTLAAEVLGR
jgi:glycosyltransferase involved in cell wall biosynthesis